MAEVEADVHVTLVIRVEIPEARLLAQLLDAPEVEHVIQKLTPGDSATLHQLQQRLVTVLHSKLDGQPVDSTWFGRLTPDHDGPDRHALADPPTS